ncbi:hypothetical protein ACFQ36_19730 [Arthrobacter sp. GCM10027362]|uniref:DUF7255 family protein n=1 Tax=Arthrobacter sp. GCM10027362 TaxID=3273379 RepID=UPI0036436FC4
MARYSEGLQRILGPRLQKPGPGESGATTEWLPANVRRSLEAVYMGFGGRNPGRTLEAGGWDFVFDGHLRLELDGPLHFNRYRGATLETEWAQRLPWAPAYREYCVQYEDSCGAGGGTAGQCWTSAAAEEMFGPAGEPGVLTGAGSPGWKQRALYDAVRDACGLYADGIRLARLCIYDTVAGVNLGDALAGTASLDRADLLKFMADRTVGAS